MLQIIVLLLYHLLSALSLCKTGFWHRYWWNVWE